MSRPSLSTALLGAAALVAALTACGGDTSSTADSASAGAPSTISAAPSAADSAAGAAAAAPAAQGAMLDPDSATRDQLATVPGMTAPAADALVAGRPYADMRAVDRALAPHLGEPARDSVYARVWKPIDLNAASDEEILLIPGVGARMLREFKEYRPYDAIEKFRREIGKYVDEAEVARLEQYVTIRPAAG